jgi:peptidoglycan/xylan/chitin deacetylase (PgdA/CDA1 family)
MTSFYASRAKDFLKDKRFLWNACPEHVCEGKGNNSLKIALTFDVEVDGGSSGVNSIQKSELFLEKIEKDLEDKPATFFLQADIIPRFERQFRALVKKHEIGLHCLHHTGLWSDPVWFLKEKPFSRAEKIKQLEKALQLFEKHTLPKPHVFRAPNMVINQDSLEVLSMYGFRIDSSFDSFRGQAVVQHFHGIAEIPVSNFGLTEVLWHRRLLPVRNFKVFNQGNVDYFGATYVTKNIGRIIKKYNLSHLVFLAHSWDFSKESVFQVLQFLEREYKVEYVTLTGLARSL